MPEQHIQIMKGLGFNDDQIKVIEEMTPEQLKEFKPDIYVQGVQTNMKTTLSNDPDFLSSIPEDKINKDILRKIESGQYARFQNELVEVATKKLGLEDKDLTPDDRKSIKGLAEKMAVTYLNKKGNVEGLQAMQKELLAAQTSLEELKNSNMETMKTELEKINGANTMKLIKTLMKVELNQVEGVDLPVAANFISEPVLAIMNSKYTLILDDNDNFVLKQKANPALDVTEGGKVVTFKDALKKELLANKLGVEKKADDPNDPTKKKRVIIGGKDDGSGDDVTDVPDYINNKIKKVPTDKE